MVARIKTGKSIKGALNYNEHKVQQGAAELILAAKFACDVEDLSFSEKLQRFEHLNKKSQKVKTNTLHISLNFPPGEKPDTETLQNIATDYMAKIGFGNQPYLVYRHDDSGHDHIHIVTTPIKQNGRSINIHNIGRIKSEPVRKAIEQKYGLIPAEGRKQGEVLTLQPVDLQAAFYGKTETKRTISNIVREVVTNYKYTSLEELNMILRQFNVLADRGRPGSRQHQNRGLVYSIIDTDGNKIGIPIKASSIYSSPTLNNLEKKFDRNRITRISQQKYTKNRIDWILTRNTASGRYLEELKTKKIQCVFQRDDTGKITDISFIDHNNRSVFHCQELGYTVETLLGKLNRQQTLDSRRDNPESQILLSDQESIDQFTRSRSLEILKTLLAAETAGPDLDPGFLKKKRKKKKRGL